MSVEDHSPLFWQTILLGPDSWTVSVLHVYVLESPSKVFPTEIVALSITIGLPQSAEKEGTENRHRFSTWSCFLLISALCLFKMN